MDFPDLPPSSHKGEDHGSFTPDGRLILFIADRENGRRLYRLPIGGGEAQPLTLTRSDTDEVSSAWVDKMPGEAVTADEFLISPDGRTLAFLATDGPVRPDINDTYQSPLA